MSIDKAAEAYAKRICKERKWISEIELNTEMKLFVEYVSSPEAAALHSTPKWVKASERLPEKPDVVWRFIDLSYAGFGYCKEGFKWEYSGYVDEMEQVEWLAETSTPVAPDLTKKLKYSEAEALIRKSLEQFNNEDNNNSATILFNLYRDEMQVICKLLCNTYKP